MSTTELSQLLKFPILVEHFIEQKRSNPESTIWEFLVLHYNNHLEGHPINTDHETDQKLPFIQHTDTLNVLVCFNSYLFSFPVKKATSDKHKTPLRNNDSFIDSNYLSSIWQPPQFC
ncbi:MAG: hypothetical protein LBQ84_00710 [Flavobacteriaceae bacterium]|jgi:hypothetical protein|nr:hypothetical protein [Flavobacteriaceae bacterium]